MISEIERSISGFITRLHAVSGKFALMTDHSEVIDAALPLFSKINKLVSILELLPETTLDEAETVCVSNVVSSKTVAHSEAVTDTPPKPKGRRGRKRKATSAATTLHESATLPASTLSATPAASTLSATPSEAEHITSAATTLHESATLAALTLPATPSEAEHIPELDIFTEPSAIVKTEPDSFSDAGVDVECTSVDGGDLKVERHEDDYDHDDRDDCDDRDDHDHDHDDHDNDDGGGGDDDEVDEVILNDVSKSDLEGKTLSETLELLKFPKTGRTKKVAVCDECGKIYGSSSGLRQHKMIKHGAAPRHQCNKCSRGFMSHTTFMAHKLSHVGMKAFHCGECPKTYTSKQNLDDHTDYTHRQKKVSCGVCGRLVARSSLTVHSRTHQPQPPCVCSCGKSYSSNKNLLRHQQKCINIIMK